MEKIETLAKSYIEAFDFQTQLAYRDKILKEISMNTLQFESVNHLYLVGRALFDILSSEEIKRERLYKTIVNLALYCFFKFMVETRKNKKREERASEYAESSVMTFILLCENEDYIGPEVLMPRLHNDAETTVNQLFGLLMVCYLNHKLSPVNIILSEDIKDRYEEAKQKHNKAIVEIDSVTHNKLENFIFGNIETLVKIFENSFYIFDDDYIYDDQDILF